MQIDGKMEQNDHTFFLFFFYSLLHSSNCHRYMYSANESSTYMTSVGKGGGQQKVSHQHIFFLSRALGISMNLMIWKYGRMEWDGCFGMLEMLKQLIRGET